MLLVEIKDRHIYIYVYILSVCIQGMKMFYQMYLEQHLLSLTEAWNLHLKWLNG